MVAPLRELAVSAGEASLPGDTRPPGFKGQGARAGGPLSFDWWVEFADGDGIPVPGGSATVQWYAVNINGDLVTTPDLGDAVAAAGLAVAAKGIGDKLWPWPIVTAMTAPGGATKLRIYLTTSATQQAEVDTSGLEAALEAAIADVPDDTIALLNTGTSPLSRVTASAEAAITAASLATAANVSAVSPAVITALNTGTSTLSRVEASASTALTNANLPTTVTAAVIAALDEDFLGSLRRIYESVRAAMTDMGVSLVLDTTVTTTTKNAAVAGPISLLSAGGADVWKELVAVMITAKTANLDFEIKTPTKSLGQHSLLQDQCVFMSMGNLPGPDGKGMLLRADNEEISMDATTASAVTVTYWWRTNEP